MAFAATKGLPNTSIRRLLDTLADYGVKVFVLHDLDITGRNIAHTLANSTGRYVFRNDLDIVEMGVRLVDAEALGLESEPFKLDQKADVQKLRARLINSPVVNHKRPHRGDAILFWDIDNLEVVTKAVHDSVVQSEENKAAGRW